MTKRPELLKKMIFAGAFLALLGLLSFLCLYRLDVLPLQNWDEARHGVSAYEMIMTGDPVVTTYGYEPDYWNLKPPLSEYCIALFYRLFGFSIPSLRLYAALSTILCALACSIYALRHLGRAAGLFTLLSFSAVPTYLFTHGARSGDADALYVLLYTMAVLCLSMDTGSAVYPALAGLFGGLAFLTKSWHAGIIVLIILLTYFIRGRREKHSGNSGNSAGSRSAAAHVLISAVSCAVPVLIWAAMRIMRDGFSFIGAMIGKDVVSRSVHGAEDHAEDVLYYAGKLLADKGIIACLTLIVVLLAAGGAGSRDSEKVRRPEEKVFRASGDRVPVILGALLPVVLFSIPATKLSWYVYCAYPCIFLLASQGLQLLWERLKGRQSAVRTAAAILIVFLISALSARNNVRDLREFKKNTLAADVALFTLIDRTSDYAGSDIYIDIVLDTEESWEQRDFLAAELSGDLHPREGEAAGWLSDPEALLLVNRYTIEALDERAEYRVVAASPDELYYILAHGKD